MTDKPKKSHKSKFAKSLADILSDYETLPDAEKYEIDKAIVKHLDISPKDWRLAMQALIDNLRR